MWNPQQVLLQSYLIRLSVYDHAGLNIQKKCLQMHKFNVVWAGAPNKSFNYDLSMPVINIIDCKHKGHTKAYLFLLSIFSKSLTTGNISVFEDLNFIQMDINKADKRWTDCLILWWSDLKTANHMLDMQYNSAGMTLPYNRYQHLFPDLAFWHLLFNYLKIV